MRKFAVIVLLAVLAACGSATKEELASLAAKGYYDRLIHGEYEQFYEGMDQRTLSDGTTLSDEAVYRSQMPPPVYGASGTGASWGTGGTRVQCHHRYGAAVDECLPGALFR